MGVEVVVGVTLVDGVHAGFRSFVGFSYRQHLRAVRLLGPFLFQRVVRRFESRFAWSTLRIFQNLIIDFDLNLGLRKIDFGGFRVDLFVLRHNRHVYRFPAVAQIVVGRIFEHVTDLFVIVHVRDHGPGEIFMEPIGCQRGAVDLHSNLINDFLLIFVENHRVVLDGHELSRTVGLPGVNVFRSRFTAHISQKFTFWILFGILEVGLQRVF